MSSPSTFELLDVIGRGDDTIVHRAYDLLLNREVAIKELVKTIPKNSRRMDRFLREAQFLAQFEHDNIVRIYSVDHQQGWIVMELLKGTLAALIAERPSHPDLVR